MHPKHINEEEIDLAYDLSEFLYDKTEINTDKDFFINFLFEYAGKYTMQIFKEVKSKFLELFYICSEKSIERIVNKCVQQIGKQHSVYTSCVLLKDVIEYLEEEKIYSESDKKKLIGSLIKEEGLVDKIIKSIAVFKQ